MQDRRRLKIIHQGIVDGGGRADSADLSKDWEDEALRYMQTGETKDFEFGGEWSS